MERTVLVIGAGASTDVKLPLGGELLGLMQSSLGEHCAIRGVDSRVLEHKAGEFHELKRICADSTSSSIDELIRRRPSIRRHAAIRIAEVLLGKQALASRNIAHSKTWRTELYLAAVKPCEGVWKLGLPPSDDLAIVTFNYDMTIEMAIARHLAADEETDALAAWNHAKQLPIFHLHGKLDPGDRFVQSVVNEAFTDERAFTLEELESAGKSLAMAWEHDDQWVKQHAAKARSLLRRARRVFFFGFGFDPENMRKLGYGPDSGVAHESASVVLSTGHAAIDHLKRVREKWGIEMFVNPNITNESLVRAVLTPVSEVPRVDLIQL